MDLLKTATTFASNIEKLGKIKLLILATKAQEKAAEASKEARELFNKYLESR